MKAFQGKTIVITGAAMGLGRQLAQQLSSVASQLILLDSRPEVKDFASQLENAEAFVVDLSQELQIRDAFEKIKTWPVDILINNAGVVSGGDFLDVDWDAHRKTFAVNLLAPLLLTKYFLPKLLDREGSRIINVASIAGFLGFAKASSYAASKWGLVGFTESLELELNAAGKKWPRLHLICPSYIATGMFEGAEAARCTTMLEPSVLAKSILKNVQAEKFRLIEPKLARLIPVLRGLLPHALFQNVLRIFGIDRGMKTWKGRS